MEKERLLEMAGDPDLVVGIHNYCDRWCEHCGFTSRCLFCRMREDEGQSAKTVSSDHEKSDFLKGLDERLSLAKELLRDLAEREPSALDAMDLEAQAVEAKGNLEAAYDHDCCQAAIAYSDMVDKWFYSGEDLLLRKKAELRSAAKLALPGRDPVGEAREMREAEEVLLRYQEFVYKIIMTALENKALGGAPALGGSQSDFDVPAQMTLNAITRSIAAWAHLLHLFGEKERETLALLAHLQGLRRSVQAVFQESHKRTKH